MHTPETASRPDHDMDRRAFLCRSGAALGGVLGAGLLGLGSSTSRAVAEAERAFSSPFEWVEVRPGVHATSNLATGGNCLLVRGGDRCLLVDTKFPAFAPRIKRDAQALTGVAPTHVVNTHHHGDHSGGNQAFTGDAVVIAHANGVPRVRSQFERNMSGVTGGGQVVQRAPESFREELAGDAAALLAQADGFEASDWVANTPVRTSATGLDLGGSWAQVRHFGRPSHTDNDLVVHLVDHNVVHTGDVVFNGLHPFFDANGGASSTAWIETLAEIEKLCDAETVIVPGHGPAGDRDIVRAQRNYIEQLRDWVEKGVINGTPLDDLRTQTFPFMEGMGFDQLRENAIVFVYNEMTLG